MRSQSIIVQAMTRCSHCSVFHKLSCPKSFIPPPLLSFAHFDTVAFILVNFLTSGGSLNNHVAVASQQARAAEPAGASRSASRKKV